MILSLLSKLYSVIISMNYKMLNVLLLVSGSLTGTSGGSSMSPVTSLGLAGSPLSSMASLNSLNAMSNGSGLDSLTSAYQQYAGSYQK